jgi:flagellar protein FlaJ
MSFGWRERLALRLRVRYKVRRIYFTLVIPVLIAILIFGLALYTGFASLPNLSSGASTSSPQASVAQQRLQAYEKLYGNATANQGTATNIQSQTNPHNFDLVLVGALTIGLGPYSIDVTRAERMRRKNEVDFSDFLFEMSELIRGGIDPIKAVVTLSEGSTGSITKQVRITAKQMQIGYTFEQAMRNLSASLHSSLIDRYVDLVIQASYSGGSVSNLIQRASADMSNFISLENEKRAGLAQYTVILYVGQAVLITLCAILVIQFLPELSQINNLGTSSFTGSLLSGSDIGSVPLERDLFFLIVINGLMGGLVIGKISEAKIRHGIKHSLILVLIGFVAWSLFVVPAVSTAGANYPYRIVSYDKQGVVTLPMNEPIVVEVNDTYGGPAPNVPVIFSITGPAKGAVLPATVSTDADGIASSTVILGNMTGTYDIGVTVGSNTTAVSVTAVAGGG